MQAFLGHKPNVTEYKENISLSVHIALACSISCAFLLYLQKKLQKVGEMTKELRNTFGLPEFAVLPK